MSLATIVKGNTFSLAIPLQVYAVEDGEVVLRDYTPESGDVITVRLKGERRNYTYIPSTNGNIAYIHLEGSEVVGMYAVEVEIVKDDDSKLTSMRFGQLEIVESIDELNDGQITDGIEQGAIYLDPEIFIAGKDGRGIVSIVKTATSGLVDTYTITYTDNTTSTFNVTNGKDGINGQDGADGQDGVGITSIAKTGTSGLVDTYTITLTNGTTYTYQVTNGKDGEDGADGTDGTDGVGIVSITKTSTAGLVDTYTILLTNGTTTTFTVTNGSDATQVQSDWSQSDNTKVDYIKNKPTIPTKTSDLTNDSCPLIEDTRSSASDTYITGTAPFATLTDGQRIVFHFKYNNAASPSLQLTLSGGTTTSAYPLYQNYNNGVNALTLQAMPAGSYGEFVFDSTNSRWVLVGKDFNTTYSNTTQADINSAAQGSRLIEPKLIHDNAYIVEESYSSGSLKANKMYDFGTVSTALTIPSLDASNDLVSNALNFYALRFIAGADDLNITFPTGVIVDDEPTINTGDYVEIMINLYVENSTNHFYASIKVWQAPSQNS